VMKVLSMNKAIIHDFHCRILMELFKVI